MQGDTPQEIQDKQAVGQKIQKFRDEMGLSQLQLAERMGKNYTRKSVSSFENGTDHMRIGALFAICDIFGVGLEELGPDRLLTDQNALLEDYRSLNLKNRETLKSLLGYLMNQQGINAADVGGEGDVEQQAAEIPEDTENGHDTGGMKDENT